VAALAGVGDATGVRSEMPWVVYVGRSGHPPTFIFATPSRALAARLATHLQMLVQPEQRLDITIFFRRE
jgi:hypothetical protein